MKSKSSIRHSVFFLALAACSLTGAYANDQILNSDPINVSGYVSEPQATDHELEKVKHELQKQRQAIQVNKEKAKVYNKLGRSTEKLSDATEQMIDERRESQATIDKYNKKIACLMEENPGRDCDEYVKSNKNDSVSIAQAAPVNNNIVMVSENEPSLLTGDLKVLPYLGYTALQSENENLEASISTGIRVEADITSRLSIGMGFNYTSLQTLDGGNQFSNFYNPTYYDTYGFGGREIEYKNYNFDIAGKFFLTTTNRLRPYIGAGLGFNRTNMKYADTTSYSFGNSQFGNEELVTSSLNMQLLLGSEITVTSSIGFNLEFGYKKGFGRTFNTDSSNAVTIDQQRLVNLNDELAEANIFSVNAGMVVYF